MAFDEKKKSVSGKALNIICLLGILIYFLGFSAHTGFGQNQTSVTPLYKVYNFRNITAAEGINYLRQAGLSVECQIVKGNIVTLTGAQVELAKAFEVIRLVDAARG